MREQFVTYEIARSLKELGFNETTMAFFANEELFPKSMFEDNKSKWYISAPLWQQVIDWLWEKHKIFVTMYLLPPDKSHILWLVKSNVDNFYSDKEQAILKAIELCQK